ncbi:polyadenylate-binding protein-interacting protein 5-like [Melia azedarach]|uniref:Polyadenylate-binding protein-interacting protein 5-like n=1 Tax=Melia azedarach TaxID=155640 RepID=A0ACC1XA29_MELAZ|nr:polyadenylate-binding protein-interacting protein 5-like [Melia azedarach]
MKPGVSSLNPYAASYIPLSKREACDRTEPTTKDSKSCNENVWYSHHGHVTQNPHRSKVSHSSVAQGAQKLATPEGSTTKSLPVHGSYGSSSKQGDLEATVDMLTQLERMSCSFDAYHLPVAQHIMFDTVESSENLPDTLDIGDVSESGSSSECASVKLKTAVGEASASSSGPSGSAVVS